MVIVDVEKCIGCGLCKNDCLLNEIEIINGKSSPKNKTCFNCGHCIAICPVNAVSFSEGNEEVREMTPDEYEIDSQKLLNLLRFRRTTRKFKKQPIEDTIFKNVLEAGRLSPTGMNSEEIRFIVFRDELKKLTEKTLLALSDLADDTLADETSPKAMKAYAHMWKRMNKDYFESGIDSLFYDSAAVVVVVANTKFNKLTPPIDGAIACANIELLARTYGLGTCYIGFLKRAVIKHPEINDFIGINPNEEFITAFSIGYPDVRYYRTVPRKKDKVIWR